VFELAISLLAVPVLWALREWRLALLLCLATALLQDPLRKLTPGTPVVFVTFVGVVFVAACLGALVRGIPLSPNRIFKGYRQLAVPLSLLAFIIIIEAVNSFVRFENPMITGLGLMTYVLPFLSLSFAYQLASRQGEFRIAQFIKWYVIFVSLTVTTVYLEFLGYDWPVLGQIGPNFVIFDHTTGIALKSASGLFRANEIAAWHAMTAACFVLLMFSLRRMTFKRLLTAVVMAALLMAIGSLTGRRKIVIEFAVFVSTYLILWIILEKGVGKLAITALTGAALVGYFWLAVGLQDDVRRLSHYSSSVSYSTYLERSQNVFEQAPARFVEVGIAPIMSAYDSFGLFGAGLGTGTQGGQYFGRDEGVAGTAEGGLGKIALELGIPGLFVMGWCAILFIRYLWRIIRAALRQSVRVGRLSIGLFSFLVANVAGFSVATQAYGDFFVLLILSWTLGFLLAVPALVEREARAREPKIFEETHSVLRPKIVVSSRI
jgi:hypothetical protein